MPKNRFAPFSCLAALVLGPSAMGCQYDLEKLYQHKTEVDGGGGDVDAGQDDGGVDAAVDSVPDHLIELWTDPALPDGCADCARSSCADVNASCKDDPDCLAFTRCVAKAQDPSAQNDCRADFAEWLAQDITGRDIGGPYQMCVFQNSCASVCDSRDQRQCRGRYEWPLSTEKSVPLRLRLVEGLSSMPAAGVRIRACQPENPSECMPLTDWTTSDEQGVIELDVKLQLGSFTGYFELEGADLYPTLLRFGWPIARELVTNVTVVSAANVALLESFASDIEMLDDRGLLQLRVFGCNGIAQEDVAFSVDMSDASTADWYAGQEILPDFNRPGTGERGAGGIVNVVPGRRRVTATANDQKLASFSVPVRAQYMTVVFVVPGDESLM